MVLSSTRRGRTGYLAKAFETEDLARGIAWVLAQHETGRLGEQARERAVERFAAPVVAEQYWAVYEEPTVAVMEKPGHDIKLSSLKRYVEATGGKLRIDVELPDGTHFGFSV